MRMLLLYTYQRKVNIWIWEALCCFDSCQDILRPLLSSLPSQVTSKYHWRLRSQPSASYLSAPGWGYNDNFLSPGWGYNDAMSREMWALRGPDSDWDPAGTVPGQSQDSSSSADQNTGAGTRRVGARKSCVIWRFEQFEVDITYLWVDNKWVIRTRELWLGQSRPEGHVHLVSLERF